MYDPPIVLEPDGFSDACVIWLHGLGADGNDFVPIVNELDVPKGIRYIFPHAQPRPVTINGGYVMRAWYDISEVDLQRTPDLEGVRQSVDYLDTIIRSQMDEGLPLSRLILAGFSQGGVVALDCALRMPEKPAGLLALSTYLAEPAGSGEGLQVFQGHGTHDDIVLPRAADAANAQLRELGAQVDRHDYPMAHSVCGEEIADISAWITQRLVAH